MSDFNVRFTSIKTENLLLNEGQIEGLPKNPRFIKDERFEALKKSVLDAPEMLQMRMLIVYPFNGNYVTIAGNMRLRVCLSLGYKEVPCVVLPKETSVEKLREYAIKDNVPFGQTDWESLANEWEIEELQGWGLECDFLQGDSTNIDDLFEESPSKEKDNSVKLEVIIPEEISDNKDDIKKLLEETLKDYEGVTVK